MGERVTLKQIGEASTAFDNQPIRFPELNANFELKSDLINLLLKFYGRPGEDPIKHIKDFEVICATTGRTGIQTNYEINNGVRQQERCHKACKQLKISSIELGSFSLGTEILWLADGCDNIGVAIVECTKPTLSNGRMGGINPVPKVLGIHNSGGPKCYNRTRVNPVSPGRTHQ
ncbi:hypothetical protein PIB30_082396 [Stylosanthes scabra]|uniref:Uncharacterized protein n=1 Tax=Stylosanthes scabra TaxID=79078 RepID=A0ABU6RS54_9FABA|nr:hypothetical protein [Stylosanthes scabra]